MPSLSTSEAALFSALADRDGDGYVSVDDMQVRRYICHPMHVASQCVLSSAVYLEQAWELQPGAKLYKSKIHSTFLWVSTGCDQLDLGVDE